MHCDAFRDRIEAFLDEALPSDTGSAFAIHAEDCPECRAALDARRSERAAIRELLSVEPPPDLRHGILRRAAVAPLSAPAMARTRRLWPLAAAALLASALGLRALFPAVDAQERGGQVLAYLDGAWEPSGSRFEEGLLVLPAAPGRIHAGPVPAEGGSR